MSFGCTEWARVQMTAKNRKAPRLPERAGVNRRVPDAGLYSSNYTKKINEVKKIFGSGPISRNPRYRELVASGKGETHIGSILPRRNFAAKFVEEIEDEADLVHLWDFSGDGSLQHGEAVAIWGPGK